VSEHRRYRRHLARELDNVALYRDLADSADGEHREILLGLAAAEERHAHYWKSKLNDLGVAVSPGETHRQGLVTRSLSWLARRLGLRRVVPLLERREAGERNRYDNESAATTAMVTDERIHAELVAGLAPAWRSRAAGSLRAAVFGVNDGLVSNLSLVMGMAGGHADTKMIVLAGMAGLVAGAGSMAAGEYISVKSQLELVEAGSTLRPEDLAAIERDPVALEFLGKTFLRQHLGQATGRVGLAGPPNLMTLGSPRGAAASSFLAFGLGAAVPLLPAAVRSHLGKRSRPRRGGSGRGCRLPGRCGHQPRDQPLRQPGRPTSARSGRCRCGRHVSRRPGPRNRLVLTGASLGGAPQQSPRSVRRGDRHRPPVR
jgi:VIT1/CCC1 family predicted Fe2+/Mn2+ transporter